MLSNLLSVLAAVCAFLAFTAAAPTAVRATNITSSCVQPNGTYMGYSVDGIRMPSVPVNGNGPLNKDIKLPNFNINAPITPGVYSTGDGPGNATNSKLTKRDSGRIEVRWQWSDDGGFFGKLRLWMEYYPTNTATVATCTEYQDLSHDYIFGGGINGKWYYSPSCDILAIYDGPNGDWGDAPTYTSGHGVNCGWVNSYSHTSQSGFFSIPHYFYFDFYHHCSWG